MTLRVPVSALSAGERALDHATSRYLVKVHRSRVGEAFTAFDVDAGLEADAQVLSADPRAARIRLGTPRPAPVTSPLPVTLLWAVGKADKPEAVIRDATALGVRRIVLCTTERTVVRLGERAEARRPRWQSVAREAARQSGRGDVPELVGPVSLAEALALGAGSVAMVLDPKAELTLAQVLAPTPALTPLSVLIGPEGGLDDGELAAAAQAGFRAVRFGRLVLRTETAAVAVLGALLGLADGRT